MPMLYRQILGVSLCLSATLLVGCANTSTGHLKTSFTEKPNEVCIVRNPKVQVSAAIPSLKQAFERRNIKTTIVDNFQDCHSQYCLQYVMRKSWDFTTYLGSVELSLYKDNTLVSSAQYKAGSMTLTKWGKTADRIDETVGKLLGEH